MMRSLLIFLVAGIVVFAPVAASAATVNFFGPIVPNGTNNQPDCRCPESAPDWGCVLQTFQNLTAFVISIAVIIVTLVAAYAGILMITSPFNAENRSKARSMLMSSVIGLVITMSAWLIVDFVMKALYSPTAAQKGLDTPDALPWNAILGEGVGTSSYCLDKTEIAPGTSTSPDTTPTTPGTGTGSQAPGGLQPSGSSGDGASPNGCTNCVKVTALVPHKNPPEGCDLNGGNDGVAAPNPAITSCYVTSSLFEKLKKITAPNWLVTEMWPPTRDHGAPCHNVGTCVDASFHDDADKTDGEKILKLMQTASAAGITPVYEFRTKSACLAFQTYVTQNHSSLSTFTSKLIDVVTGQTGNGHFSFYNSPSDAVNTPGCN